MSVCLSACDTCDILVKVSSCNLRLLTSVSRLAQHSVLGKTTVSIYYLTRKRAEILVKRLNSIGFLYSVA